jgi:hypothetical protein
MTPSAFSRRLLAALAGSTPAFTRTPVAESDSPGHRLLSALAGTTRAFTPDADRDQKYSSTTSGHGRSRPGAPAGLSPRTTSYIRPDEPPFRNSDLSAFVSSLTTWPAPARLAARSWVTSDALEVTRFSAQLAATTCRLLIAVSTSATPEYVNDVMKTLKSELNIYSVRIVDWERFSSLVERAQRAGNSDFLSETDVFGMMGAVNTQLSRALTDFLEDVRERRDRNLDPAVKSAIEQLTSALRDDLDRTNEVSRRFGSALLLDVQSRLHFDRDLVRAIDLLTHTLDDMSGVDLSGVDLAGVSLVGVRWTEATRWPENWVAWVRRNSIEVGPERYKIRSQGSADVDTPV